MPPNYKIHQDHIYNIHRHSVYSLLFAFFVVPSSSMLCPRSAAVGLRKPGQREKCLKMNLGDMQDDMLLPTLGAGQCPTNSQCPTHNRFWFVLQPCSFAHSAHAGKCFWGKHAWTPGPRWVPPGIFQKVEALGNQEWNCTELTSSYLTSIVEHVAYQDPLASMHAIWLRNDLTWLWHWQSANLLKRNVKRRDPNLSVATWNVCQTVATSRRESTPFKWQIVSGNSLFRWFVNLESVER